MCVGRHGVKIKNLKQSLKQWLFERYEVPTLESSLRRLKGAGFRPAVWVDVGAHQGEVADLFLQIWPQSTGVCLEGQAGPLRRLQERFQNKPNIRIVAKLAGASAKKEVVLHGQETSASILEENVNPQAGRQEVEMTTLDLELGGDPALNGPKLIKIDTQGYELEILEGAETTLKTTEVLILELNFIEIHKGVPLGDEIIRWLRDKGFCVFDITGITRRPKDRTLWQADFVFVPEKSFLRTDKSYE